LGLQFDASTRSTVRYVIAEMRRKRDFVVLRFGALCCGTLKLASKATRITGPYSPPLWD
jgi:hypothetical protein